MSGGAFVMGQGAEPAKTPLPGQSEPDGSEEIDLTPEADVPDEALEPDGSEEVDIEGDGVTDAVQGAGTKKKQKFVPHEALHQARQEAKSARDQVQQLQAEMARYGGVLEGRLAQIQDAFGRVMAGQQGQQQDQRDPEPEIPDENIDPAGYFKAMFLREQRERERLAGQVNQIAENIAAQGQVAQRQTMAQRIASTVRSAEESFKAQAPDYDDAVDYIRQIEDKRYTSLGVTDPMERRRLVQGEMNRIVATAMGRNQNPAHAAYQFARSVGYAPKQQSQAQSLEMIAQGQKVARSVSGAPGKAAGRLTLQDVANMSQSDFDKIINDDAKFKRLFGGS